MKQIILKDPNGKIKYKYYINNLNKANGIAISYWNSGNILYKRSYINGKLFGVNTKYHNNNNKPTNITYETNNK